MELSKKGVVIVVAIFFIIVFGMVKLFDLDKPSSTNNITTSESQLVILPKDACTFLKEEALDAQGYKEDGMGGYFCISPAKLYDTRSNLTFYADGSLNEISKMTLELRVFNSPNSNIMINDLIKNARILSQKALNQELSNSIITAIQNRTNIKETFNNYTLEVYNDNFNSGYSIQFSIKK